MKRSLSVVLLTILLSGCSLFNRGNDPASRFKSLEDTWAVAQSAYDAYCDKVVAKKIDDPTKIALADAAWNQFRASFRAAVVAASRGMETPTPPELKTQTIDLIATLNPK